MLTCGHKTGAPFTKRLGHRCFQLNLRTPFALSCGRPFRGVARGASPGLRAVLIRADTAADMLLTGPCPPINLSMYCDYCTSNDRRSKGVTCDHRSCNYFIPKCYSRQVYFGKCAIFFRPALAGGAPAPESPSGAAERCLGPTISPAAPRTSATPGISPWPSRKSCRTSHLGQFSPDPPILPIDMAPAAKAPRRPPEACDPVSGLSPTGNRRGCEEAFSLVEKNLTLFRQNYCVSNGLW